MSDHRLPERPGYGAELRRETLRHFRTPDGPAWSADPATASVAVRPGS